MKEQDAAHSFEHDENECVFYLDNESVVFGCECGNIEIGGKTYYPEEKLTRLRSELQQKDEETTALKMKSEAQLQSYLYTTDTLTKKLQQERQLRMELVECIESYVDLELFANPKPIESLIEKAKL